MVQGVVIEEGKLVDVSPRTGEVVARVPVSSEAEVVAAVAAARAAQVEWALRPLAERVALLKRAIKEGVGHGGSEERLKELAELMTREMGKLEGEAREEAEGVADKDELLELVEEANADVVVGNGKAVITREPHGVVGVLSPWNFGFDEPLLLALPALAAGNAVVVKPSEVTPLCGAAVVEGMQAVLPKGLVGLVQGDGSVGAVLVDAVDMVAMTGSSATGVKILEKSAKDLKRVVLELGGKDPMVLLDTADLDLAAKDAVAFSVMNAGQVCCAIERVYCPASLASVFEAKVLDEAKSYDPRSGTLAPLVSKVQKDIVTRHVEEAVAAGARCLLGGPEAAKALDADMPPGSCYVPVTVLADVPHDANREETFGPVVAITPYDDLDVAVGMANDTRYGLSACVYGDKSAATAVAKRLKAGQVGVNAWPLAVAPLQCPWVGHKHSGYGYHSGFDGWRQFSTPKSIIQGN